MKQDPAASTGLIHVSIGIIAWNEEDAIKRAIESLFAQSIFAKLRARGQRVEIICVVNGCTDSTPAVVARIFQEKERQHAERKTFSLRLVDIPERGKINAWNLFVHSLSAPESRFLFLMDGDIVLNHPDTLWNMLSILVEKSDANVSTDKPLKDISYKGQRSIIERISLATSTMSQAVDAQLTGQLYCIRAEVARKIYLPLDLAACEDGFIKALVCTDFLASETNPRRIVRAQDASHVFEAYTSVADVLKNQKRQMIGQTILHVLDLHLRSLPQADRDTLAVMLRDKEKEDPTWLRRLVGEHVRRTPYFWKLFPGIVEFRFKRLLRLKGHQRLTHAPVALVGFGVTMTACFMARRLLDNGFTQYWPDTKSRRLEDIGAAGRKA